MNFEETCEFPCGLKYTIKYSAGFFTCFGVSWDTKDIICPIHGKECKKQKDFNPEV